jgi:hypothetical protein
MAWLGLHAQVLQGRGGSNWSASLHGSSGYTQAAAHMHTHVQHFAVEIAHKLGATDQGHCRKATVRTSWFQLLVPCKNLQLLLWALCGLQYSPRPTPCSTAQQARGHYNCSTASAALPLIAPLLKRCLVCWVYWLLHRLQRHIPPSCCSRLCCCVTALLCRQTLALLLVLRFRQVKLIVPVSIPA